LRFHVIIILLLFSVPVIGQVYYSEHLTTTEGLPSNSIRCVFKDSRGFLWIGTDGGASRYDGITFRNYNSSNGLVGDQVWSIVEDDQGALWFGCYGSGITRFDGNEFKNYTSHDGLVDAFVRVVHYSQANNSLIIGTNSGFSILKGETFINYSVENGKLNQPVIVTSILEDDTSYLILSYYYQNYLISKRDYTIHVVKTRPFDNTFTSSSFIDSRDDTIVGFEKRGIAIFKDHQRTIYEPIGQVFGIVEDCKNTLWLASWNGGISPPGGLFCYRDGHFTPMNKFFGFTSVLGWCVYWDSNEQLLWYGTLDQGLYKIPLQRFVFYSASYFGETTLKVNDLLVDCQNSLWIVTDSVLLIYHGMTTHKIRYTDFIATRVAADKRKIKNNGTVNQFRTVKEWKSDFEKLACIDQATSGTIFISASPMGIFSVDSKSYRIEHLYNAHSRQFIIDSSETVLECDEWALSPRTVSKKKNGGKPVSYQYGKEIPHHIHKIVNTPERVWFCGATEGIYYMKKDRFYKLNDIDTTFKGKINDIITTDKWTILGGNDGRVHLLEEQQDTLIKHYDFVCDKSQVQWLQVTSKYLFAGTSSGVLQYNLSDIQSGNFGNRRKYDKRDGVGSTSWTVATINQDKQIWCGTSEGLVRIDTRLLETCLSTPNKTIITKVELQNKPINWTELTGKDLFRNSAAGSFELQPDQNHLTFYFHTISYSDPLDEMYYYMLKGIDTSWNGPTDKTYVIYPQIPSGEYTFLARSYNCRTDSYSQKASISFRILTPWYHTWWFYAISSFLLIMILLSLYTIRIRDIKIKEKRKREILSRISELESRALQAQMNPHFIFNSLSSIQNFVLDNDVDNALKFLTHFSKVIRMTFDHVDKKMITLDKELEYVEHYIALEQMRFDDNFIFEKCIDPAIDTSQVLIPPMILQPFLENSILHGVRNIQKKGVLKLLLQVKDTSTFVCIIEDNGIGRVKAMEMQAHQKPTRESKGISITKERLNQFQDQKSASRFLITDLYDDDGGSLGTRVEIEIPMQYLE